MANDNGKKFENDIKKSIPKHYYFQRIYDQSFNFNSDITRFTKKNPFDCFVFANKTLYLFELKSTKQKSMSVQLQKKDKGMIKLHQIEALENASHYDSIVSGFLLNFRLAENFCYFIEINNFLKILKSNNKKSINIEEIKIGGFEIKNHQLKVNYRYEFEEFFKSYI